MILPTKGVRPDKALLTVGAEILRNLDEPKTVSRLWADLRQQNQTTLQVTFDWFVLALDLLFVMGIIVHVSGRVRRPIPSVEEQSP